MILEEPFEWELPDIKEGSYAISEIIVEPDASIEKSVNYLSSENKFVFDGSSEFSSPVIGKFFSIKITLVDDRGNISEFNQSVYLSSKEVEEA